MSVLSLHQISKNYGKVQALKGVSFEVPPGSVFGILGPNGSGKTTLLSIILEVLNADGGTFSWFSQPGSKLQRRGIGSLLETPNFYHYLSAVNNLRITQSISGRGDDEQIIGVLKKVNLYERRNSRFSTYSLGMKQRLAIAGALLGNPQVLVFDEPTNGLDPVGIAEIRELIRELHQQGHTIIMASHLLDEVEKVCSHVAILKSGELITTGTVDEVLADETIVEVSAENMTALNEVLNGFPAIKAKQWQDQQITLYFTKGEDPAESLNKYCFERGVVLKQLHTRKKKLEARFFELTNN